MVAETANDKTEAGTPDAPSVAELTTPKATNRSKNSQRTSNGVVSAAAAEEEGTAPTTIRFEDRTVTTLDEGESSVNGELGRDHNGQTNHAAVPIAFNPQDAALLRQDANDVILAASTNNRSNGRDRRQKRQTEPFTNGEVTPELSTKQHTQQWKTRRRGRKVRIVRIRDSSYPTSSTPTTNNKRPLSSTAALVPINQYHTTLNRRFVYKRNDGSDSEQRDDIVALCGDVSLGMKLIVVGGRVIVQQVNALNDGRASPAQLAGTTIQRGDVLLSIGRTSLVNRPVDQLMEGLQLLSSPLVDESDGKEGHRYSRYASRLNLRLESRTGLEPLLTHEASLILPTYGGNRNKHPDSATALNDMFSLFPMVDQLSGMPLFEDNDEASPQKATSSKDTENLSPQQLEDLAKEEENASGKELSSEAMAADDIVARAMALSHQIDYGRFSSEFFDWNDELKNLIHNSNVTELAPTESSSGTTTTTKRRTTEKERIQLGTKIMKLTKALVLHMEDIDKGKDMRSFKRWSSNFSLRSSASTRRRYAMDSVSLQSNRNRDAATIAAGDDENSVGSTDSMSFNGVDGDALLLRLAAHDVIWRRQVVVALKMEIEKMERGQQDSDDDDDDGDNSQQEKRQSIDSALNNVMGNFLFGEKMNEFVTKKKKSYALPPKEITTVLFDLTTQLATNTPDEITVFGGQSTTNAFSVQSNYGATSARAKASLRADFKLANRFVLDEALPVWLESFKTFPLEMRRVMWPKGAPQSGSGSFAGSFESSDSDSLTVDSWNSAPKSRIRVKELREIIEDQELDVETRAETCFLATYYFTHKILDNISRSKVLPKEQIIDASEEAASFVQKYGVYLQIQSCLACAALVESERAVEELLKVAKHDPVHRDTVKELHKESSLVFYNSDKLSGVLVALRNVPRESNESRRKRTQVLCVSAYPDVRPWQVRTVCNNDLADNESRAALEEYYYLYLSMLLDPEHGDDNARRDSKLVLEWCDLSIALDAATSRGLRRRQNFLSVASKRSNDHTAYKRDTLELMDKCISIDERNLALDLVEEILSNRKLCSKERNCLRVLECLRLLAQTSIAEANKDRNNANRPLVLKRVLVLFTAMDTNKARACRSCVNVPVELLTLLLNWVEMDGSVDASNKLGEEMNLLDLIMEASEPSDVVRTLILWSLSNEISNEAYMGMNTLLQNGVESALETELSGSLLRISHARQDYTDSNRQVLLQSSQDGDVGKSTVDIWKQMSTGQLTVDK